MWSLAAGRNSLGRGSADVYKRQTVSRVSKSLNGEYGGYRKVLVKFGDQ